MKEKDLWDLSWTPPPHTHTHRQTDTYTTFFLDFQTDTSVYWASLLEYNDIV